MNIYEKLQTCRVELQNMKFKKSGKNTFSNYDYFELQDFLPKINELFQRHKLFSQVSFDKDLATMTITNAEKPEEKLTFTSPMATAQLKGCHEIQNLGAVQTYQRRYLYVAALEIVEHDALDATTGKEDKKDLKQKPEPPKISSGCSECNKPITEDVKSYSLNKHGKALCRDCQKKAS
jgi:hypothetical protein